MYGDNMKITPVDYAIIFAVISILIGDIFNEISVPDTTPAYKSSTVEFNTKP